MAVSSSGNRPGERGIRPTIILPGAPGAELSGLQNQVNQLARQVATSADFDVANSPLGLSYAFYSTTAAQDFTTGDPITCNYGTKVEDTHNAVTVGAAWAYVAPFTGLYGLWTFNTWASTTAWAAGEASSARAIINGVAQPTHARLSGNITTGATASLSLSGNIVLFMQRGQSLSVNLTQSSGGNLALTNSALNNWIRIAFLRG